MIYVGDRAICALSVEFHVQPLGFDADATRYFAWITDLAEISSIVT